MLIAGILYGIFVLCAEYARLQLSSIVVNSFWLPIKILVLVLLLVSMQDIVNCISRYQLYIFFTHATYQQQLEYVQNARIALVPKTRK